MLNACDIFIILSRRTDCAMKNIAILFLDTDGIVVDCNAEAEALFGIGRELIINTRPETYSPEFQPGGDRSAELADKYIRQTMAGQPQVFEWQHRRPDGTLFNAEVTLNRFDVGGKTLLLTVHKDITELKAAEAARRESEAMFRSIVENSHAGVFTVDEHFVITYANDMVSLLLELPNDKIVGRDFREFVAPDDIESLTGRYLSRLAGQEVPSRYEFDILTASGGRRTVEINSTILREPTGGLRIVGQVLDVTERKEAERQLREARNNLEQKVLERTAELRQEIARREQTETELRRSQIKYRHLVESGNTIILELDTHGRVVSFNKYAEEFFGYTEAEIVGRNVIGTIVPETDSIGRDLRDMMDRILDHPEDYRLNENENIRKNGEKVWVIWVNQPVVDAAGVLREILCVGIDHTRRKLEEEAQARQAAERAAIEERGRLARDLHDAVSQTLFSAGIIAEVLPRIWDKDPAEGRRRLEEVRQLTRGALAEMRSLLFELRPAALEEAELAQLLRQLGESAAGRGGLPVEITIDGDTCAEPPPEVKLGLYRIAQEALNNTLKYAGATRAALNLNCADGVFTLMIADDGRGFDPATVRFDSFGLNIMKERAAGIGADLELTSGPGQGTSVKVIWPGKENR